MFIIKSVVRCAIVVFVLSQPRNAKPNDVQRLSNGLKSNTSLISEENVTSSDKSSSLDKSSFDKSQNIRESPSSARQRRNLDTAYHDINLEDYDEFGGPVPAAAQDEKAECILERSEFYLSWWVHENGSLKLPSPNRLGSYAGFADLSLKFQSEDSLFKHVSNMTSNNTSDVISSCKNLLPVVRLYYFFFLSGDNFHEHREQSLRKTT